MIRRRHLVVSLAFAGLACGGEAWEARGVPETPPDEQFRTGVEAGFDVYVWQCYRGQRVVVAQFGSACFGTRKPEIVRGACGQALPIEARFDPHDRDAGVDSLPVSQRWPGTRTQPVPGSKTGSADAAPP